MAEMRGADRVISKLQAMQEQAKQMDAAVIVGFTAAYALFVHENMEMRLAGQPRPSGLGVYWGPKGGPKFLEAPFRELKDVLVGIIQKALKKGVPMSQALLLAGLRVQRESMQRTPVEYGNLRASAFTRIE